MPQPWKRSRSGWTGLWATCWSWRCPCLLQGGWTRWPLKVASNTNHSMILWSFHLWYLCSNCQWGYLINAGGNDDFLVGTDRSFEAHWGLSASSKPLDRHEKIEVVNTSFWILCFFSPQQTQTLLLISLSSPLQLLMAPWTPFWSKAHTSLLQPAITPIILPRSLLPNPLQYQLSSPHISGLHCSGHSQATAWQSATSKNLFFSVLSSSILSQKEGLN